MFYWATKNDSTLHELKPKALILDAKSHGSNQTIKTSENSVKI